MTKSKEASLEDLKNKVLTERMDKKPGEKNYNDAISAELLIDYLHDNGFLKLSPPDNSALDMGQIDCTIEALKLVRNSILKSQVEKLPVDFSFIHSRLNPSIHALESIRAPVHPFDVEKLKKEQRRYFNAYSEKEKGRLLAHGDALIDHLAEVGIMKPVQGEAVVPEPVAWLHKCEDGQSLHEKKETVIEKFRTWGGHIFPLYTKPVKKTVVPELSDDQLKSFIKLFNASEDEETFDLSGWNKEHLRGMFKSIINSAPTHGEKQTPVPIKIDTRTELDKE